MPWAEISLSVSRDRAETVEQALEDCGALAVTLLDDGDEPVLEPAPGTVPLWPTVRLRGLFPANVRRDEVLAALAGSQASPRTESIAWREVADQQWERAWMDRFQPMQFGERLWIVPSGMQAPAEEGAIIIALDPGLAFGTGAHPTTALCLEWIDGQDLRDCTVIDYGCGSGVLGIAAALKGASRVDCVDIDPQALQANADNAARNGVSDRIRCLAAGDGLENGADVVLANILAGPLVELAPRLAGLLAPGGRLVLSGILRDQAGAVAAAYLPWCDSMQSDEREGWVRFCGIRSKHAGAGG